jgi:STE24 endopeptidase
VIPAAVQPSAHFDPQVATDASLATLLPAEKAKSDAYFEGGYWLALWDFLYGVGVMLASLETKLSAHARFCRQAHGVRWAQSLVYAIQFVAAITVLSFPLTVHEGFVREHKYGLLNQNFASWFRDLVVGLVVADVLAGIANPILMGIVRRSTHLAGVGNGWLALCFRLS